MISSKSQGRSRTQPPIHPIHPSSEPSFTPTSLKKQDALKPKKGETSRRGTNRFSITVAPRRSTSPFPSKLAKLLLLYMPFLLYINLRTVSWYRKSSAGTWFDVICRAAHVLASVNLSISSPLHENFTMVIAGSANSLHV